VKLLLDEMNSWRVEAELRKRGYDVVAVKRDRPELESRVDPTVVEAATAEQRAVVTNNVRDYRIVHERMRARGDDHYGIIYSYDDTLPRNKEAFLLWVSTLEKLLEAHRADEALLNREHHLRA
jgi:predicted nuclease of predicted toxin-antitoxin system